MQLWNDYEGKTIAEAYPLEKLISPEGRSAFFSTHNGTGTPAVIRIIEPHFDAAEILDRWRRVSEIADPHLITLRKFGEADLEGTPVIYAVMEPSDDNLGEVLRNRALTPHETREIAVSLVAALQALHAGGLIHGHVEPANVLATGDSIKLRSDCIREAPSNPEAPEEAHTLRAGDVHDLAQLLLTALTLRQTLPGTPLPAPFDTIIRNGLSGAWGLNQIDAALTPPAPRITPAAAATAAAVSQPKLQMTPSPIVPPAAPGTPAATTTTAATAASTLTGSLQPAPIPDPAPQLRIPLRQVQPVTPLPTPRRALWIVGSIAVLLVLILLWNHFSGSSEPATSAPQATLATTPDQPAPAPAPIPGKQPKPSAVTSSTSTPAPRAPAASTAGASTQGHWRVVAFTYNREDQARKKSEALSARFSSLHPGVFTPTGHAPYLVTLGGPMDREQATALRNRARASGLPRDTYTQNYTH